MSVVTIEINGVKKELERNDVIFCKTEEEAQALFKALTKVNYTWCTGKKLEGSATYVTKQEGHGYNIDKDGLAHCDLKWYQDPYDGEKYNIMYFDELFMPQIEIELNELYDVVKKIVLEKSDNGLTMADLYECFGTGSYSSILLNNTPESLIEKYYKWTELKEAKQEIKVGDIFKFEQWDGEEDQYIVISADSEDNRYTILWKDGSVGEYEESEILEDKKIGHNELNLFD